MKIYITDLEAYNRGFLVGEWIALPLEVDELNETINNILFKGQKACSDNYLHEEFFITDYEADMSISEYDNIYVLNEIAEALSEFDEYDLLKFKFLVHEGYIERDIIEKGLDSYEVEIYDFSDNTSFADTFELLAMQFVDDGLYGKIPKSLEFYLDYEKMARDLRMDYSEFESNIIGRIA